MLQMDHSTIHFNNANGTVGEYLKVGLTPGLRALFTFKTSQLRKLAEFCKKDEVVDRGLIQSPIVAVVRTIMGRKGKH